MDLLDHQMVDDSDSDSDVAVSPSGSSMLGKKSINRGRWTKEEVSFHSVFKHGHTVYAEDLSTQVFYAQLPIIHFLEKS